MPSDAVDMLVVHRVFRRDFHEMPRLISAVLTRDTTDVDEISRINTDRTTLGRLR
jgi:hypothetical protein